MSLELSTGPFGLFKKAWNANQTGGFFAEVSLATLPALGTTGDGFFVFDPQRYANNPPVNVVLFPFGTGSAGQTFDVRIDLFHKTDGGAAGATALYFPSGVLQFTATLGNSVGLAGRDVLDTERFCSTVSAPAFGTSGVDCAPIAAAIGAAGYKFDANTCHGFAVRGALGTATNWNCLVGVLTR